jgi:hypothetical protein
LTLGLASCGNAALPDQWRCDSDAGKYDEKAFAVPINGGEIRTTISFNSVHQGNEYSPVASLFLHDRTDGKNDAFVRFGLQFGVIPAAPDRITAYLITPGSRKEIGTLPQNKPFSAYIEWNDKVASIQAGSISATSDVSRHHIVSGTISCSSAKVEFNNNKIMPKTR